MFSSEVLDPTSILRDSGHVSDDVENAVEVRSLLEVCEVDFKRERGHILSFGPSLGKYVQTWRLNIILLFYRLAPEVLINWLRSENVSILTSQYEVMYRMESKSKYPVKDSPLR